MTHHTPMKLRAVRCIATGKVTKQSSNKTKRLLKLGGYVEVFSDGSEAAPVPTHQRPPVRGWRVFWMAATGSFCVVIVLLMLLA